MARMIRDTDWSRNPLGPPDAWPQSLQSALSICLHSAFPTAIYWGPELRLLYNDAWAPIPGPRHPAALGAPAREVWADIWHVIEPQFAHLLATGEGFSAENQMLPMRRFGMPEETYWNYSFTAIRGESGEIAGIFNSGNETTDTVLSQRQMSFLLELGEALRLGGDLLAARRTATVMLGEYLRADRVGFCEIAPDGETVTITEEWTSEKVASIGSRLMLSEFGSQIGAALSAGRILRVDDVATDPDTQDPATQEAATRIAARSGVTIPWLENGRFVAGIFIHSAEPRAWTDREVAAVQQVLHDAPSTDAAPDPGTAGTLQEGAGKRPRILVAEDEPLVAMDLEARVESMGYDVFGLFDTVSAALASLDGDLPDLALLDVNLRGQSSIPIAEALHGQGVPVVFASGYEQIAGLPQQLASLPRISKPFSNAELTSVLLQATPAPPGSRPGGA